MIAEKKYTEKLLWHGNRAVELLMQLQYWLTQLGIVLPSGEIDRLNASFLHAGKKWLSNSHFFMLFDLLLPFLIVFHYFDTLSLHQMPFLNVKLFFCLWEKKQRMRHDETTLRQFREEAEQIARPVGTKLLPLLQFPQLFLWPLAQ